VEEIALEPETSGRVRLEPARQISIRLAGTDSANVDVQIRERAGKVQVAVRTGDPQLAKSLQSDLSDLVNRLDVRGFKTETWVPATTHHAATPALGAALAGADPGQSEHSGSWSREQQSHEQNQSNQRRQSRRDLPFEETLVTEEARTENL
jgi:hypothetical protein